MSLLTIVQQAALRIGIPSPTAVATTTDDAIKQLLALANEEGEELSTGASVGRDYDWSALVTEASFTAVATEDQGAMTTIAPGFKYILNNTIFNRTLRRPVPGPLAPNQWQLLKAANVVGPYPQFRIRGGDLLLTPNPTAGDSIYFEYQSANFVLASDGTTTKSSFTADDDTCRLDEQLVTAGIIWRWKRTKGLEYAQDYQQYQIRVLNAIARDGGRQTINMGDPNWTPGVLIIPESFPSLVGH